MALRKSAGDWLLLAVAGDAVRDVRLGTPSGEARRIDALSYGEDNRLFITGGAGGVPTWSAPETHTGTAGNGGMLEGDVELAGDSFPLGNPIGFF